jgi:hypothetical protein
MDGNEWLVPRPGHYKPREMVSAERMYETQILSESTRKYPLPPL